MKLTCSRNDLLTALNIVSKAVPSKTTMSILTCILLETGDNELVLTANDTELGIETRISANIETAGAICLDAAIFVEMIRKLPDGDLSIEADESLKTVIRSGRAVFRLMGRSSDEYSYLPDVKTFDSVLMSQLTLKELIRKTIFSVSTNENNPVMTGELMDISGDQFKLVSLDGHRVSIRRVELRDSYPAIRSIIPGKALGELAKILGDEAEQEVSISITGKHALFEFDNTMVLTRLIDGEFFKIEQLLSTDYETKVNIPKKEFMECLDRAILLVREGEKKPVVMEILDEQMSLRMNTSLGSMNDELEVKKQGKDINIAFNPKFLMDVLKVIDDEMIDVYLVNQKAPCFIKDSEENYIYMVLPVNLPMD